MTTYIVGDAPVRIDDAQSTAATITVTGQYPVIVSPSGLRMHRVAGPGDAPGPEPALRSGPPPTRERLRPPAARRGASHVRRPDRGVPHRRC